ncbi:hypothetical protein [Aeromicrobium yanjiei]|uniref:Uncharacterized protein n=1 Tax=Aeromicrobium yanjiei TaxID=2662028 RepID=A0A5Q2MGF9_9ACTN|nr:hypothetical protein [Aeromicrobium yanjiei]QGG42237.1 hypothetical protein GEV26_13145 [Aeromicrobium yanjiei]
MELTAVPVPPITLVHDADLDVFHDVPSAVHDIDLDDVRHGRRAFDSRGVPLQIVDNGDWPVDLVIAEGATPAPTELEQHLKDAIRQMGGERVGLPGFESASLATVLDAVLRFQAGVPCKTRLPRLLAKVTRRFRR